MTTFVLICLGIIALCSITSTLVMIAFLDCIDENICDILCKIRDMSYMQAENHNILYDIRALKQEKARKKYISYNERDLK